MIIFLSDNGGCAEFLREDGGEGSWTEDYATIYEFEGKNYKVLLQNRVNMAETEFISDMNYFVTKTGCH